VDQQCAAHRKRGAAAIRRPPPRRDEKGGQEQVLSAAYNADVCWRMLTYADVCWQVDKNKFMQRPIILINAHLEAIHSMASASRKVKPMFMSDFNIVYFLEPHFGGGGGGHAVGGGSVDAALPLGLDAALFHTLGQTPNTWQLWVREYARGRKGRGVGVGGGVGNGNTAVAPYLPAGLGLVRSEIRPTSSSAAASSSASSSSSARSPVADDGAYSVATYWGGHPAVFTVGRLKSLRASTHVLAEQKAHYGSVEALLKGSLGLV
jgi:hypothetical protein